MFSNTAIGIEVPNKPKYISIENMNEAYELIDKAKSIKIHTDVDMDGFMSSYIMMKWLIAINKKPSEILLNNGKKHGALGITNERLGKADLLIILDSSTNELEQLCKDVSCNIIIIDHHRIEPTSKLSYHNRGYVINNMTTDEPDMSAGLLVYEFIRAKSMYDERLIENMNLYQCACVSLVTDSILLDNDRNQWYTNNTFNNNEIENTLYKLMSSISKYDRTINKSFILYKLAPLFNKAIRAYRGSEALGYMIKQPDKAYGLEIYSGLQDEYIERALNAYNGSNNKNYILMDLSELGIPQTYCGVIASKLVNTFDKSAICCVKNGDIYEGSFRGLAIGYDYFDRMNVQHGVKAAGHNTAFGVEGSIVDIEEGLKKVTKDEPNRQYEIEIYLDDNITLDMWNKLKREGLLLKLARANSMVSVQEQKYIQVNRKDVHLVRSEEKYKVYEAWDMEFISMEDLGNRDKVLIYAEDSNNEIKFFAR